MKKFLSPCSIVLVAILMFSQFVYAQSSDKFTTATNSAQQGAPAPTVVSTSAGGQGSAPMEPSGNRIGGRFSNEIREENGVRMINKYPEQSTGVSGMMKSSASNNFEGKYDFGERREFSAMPNFGPSYEGYNKESMLFAKLFGYIHDEMEDFESMDYCSEPEKTADIIIAKVKGKVGEISSVCKEMESYEKECREKATKDCSMMGQADTSYAVDEMHKYEILSGSCPVNKEAIERSCILRFKQNIEDRSEFAKENCENQWESYGKQNHAQCKSASVQMVCDEDSYLKSCLDRYGVREGEEEREEFRCPDVPQKPQCENGALKEMHDANNCLVSFQCVQNIVNTVCQLTAEEAERQSNECVAKNGMPEKTYENNCITSVKCSIQQCPYTEEQIKQKESDCIAANGKFETIKEGNCIMAVECRVVAPDTSSSGSIVGDGDSITGQVTGASNIYKTYKAQCQKEWGYQKQNCEQIKQQCKGKDDFINECIKREKGFAEKDMANAKQQCEIDSLVQIKHMERQCARIDAEKQRCMDEGTKRCETMQGLGAQCREKMTEENFRNFMFREAEKKCKFKEYTKKKDFTKYKKMEVVIAVIDTVTEEDISKVKSIVGELQKKYEIDGKAIYEGKMNPNDFGELKMLNFIVDAKLNAPESSDTAKAKKESIIAGLNPEKVVERLLELRESDVSSEYVYIIEDEANDLLDASKSIDDVKESEESKGLGYKLKLFLGFAKDSEESEIKNLEASKQRLETSIKSLGKLAEDMPNEISKDILKEQVAELERQKEDIDSLVKQKQKKSKGLIRLFGLFG